MKIASLLLEIHIGHAQSLKAKRQVIKSLKERTSSRFNVSVAEVKHQDSWQRSAIGMCICTEDENSAKRILSKLESFARSHSDCTVVSAMQEISDFNGAETNFGADDAPDYSHYSDLYDNEDEDTP